MQYLKKAIRLSLVFVAFCAAIAFGIPRLLYAMSMNELRKECDRTGLECGKRIATGEYFGIWPYNSAVYELKAAPQFKGSAFPQSNQDTRKFTYDTGWFPTSHFDLIENYSSNISHCFTDGAKKIAEQLAYEEGNFARIAAGGPNEKTGTICWIASPSEKLFAIGEDHD